MDNSESSLSYCPDFSDICGEDSSFWDFLKNTESENEITPNQGDSKVDLCFVAESEDLSNVLHNEKDRTSKLQEYSRRKLTDQKLDIKRKDQETTESDLDKSSKSVSDSKSFQVPCQENIVKNISREDEDEFWDFLKSDNISSVQGNAVCNQKPLSSAELEEMRSLSSLTLFSMDEPSSSCTPGINKPMDWNSTSSDVDCNFRYQHSTPAEIFRDLDLIMSEVDSAPGFLQKRGEKKSLRAGNNEEEGIRSVICKNKTLNSFADVVPNSAGLKKQSLKDREITDRNQLGSFQDLTKNGTSCTNFHERILSENSLETNIQACSKGNKQREQHLNSTKKYVADSNILSNSLNEDNSKSCKSSALRENDTIVDTNTSCQMIPDQSNPMKILPQSRRKENSMHLPVISPFYSISPFSDSFCHQEGFVDKQNILKSEDLNNNNSVKNSIPTPINHNMIAPDEENSSYKRNSFSEQNNNARSNSAKSTSPFKFKNSKRFLKGNSPKNSIFRITDCQTAVSDSQACAKSPTDPINNKRQKTSNIIISSSINCRGTEKDQKVHSTIPVKYVVLPTSTLGTNTTAISTNPGPLYLILPKSSQLDNNQNAELVMVINNSNPTANNADVKTSTNLTNSTVPVPVVTCSSRIVSSLIPNSSHQSISQSVQHVSLPIINVMSLQQNPNVSNTSYNYSQSTSMSNSMLQPMVDDTIKMQFPVDASTVKINTLTSSLPQTSLQTDYGNFYSVPSGLPSNVNDTRMPRANLPTISVLTNNNLQLRNINSEAVLKPLSTRSVLFPGKALQPNQFIQSVPGGSVPLRRFKQVRQQKLKPIKSISLGKDKNAIQQISIPLKMDSLTDPKMLSCVYDNLDRSANSGGLYTINSLEAQVIPDANKQVQSSQKTLIPVEQQQNILKYGNGHFSFAPHKRNSVGILVKRNLITNETEVVKRNQFLNNQPSSQLHDTNSVNLNKSSELKSFEDKVKMPISNSSQDARTAQFISMDNSDSRIYTDKPNETSILPSMGTNRSDATSNSEPPKSALATLQELFPPPISMIPVCVMQAVQTVNKPSVSKVLVLQNPSTSNNEASKVKTQRKTAGKKTSTKTKKPERKTVKQLLEERYKHATGDEMNKAYKPRVETKVLRPIYKLVGDGTLVPAALPVTDTKSLSTFSKDIYSKETEGITSLVANSNKRPNIMMLPSATKVVQSTILKNDTSKEDFYYDGPSRVAEAKFYKDFDTSPDFLFEKITSKDCKSRYYDMCELRIGYFKVEDDVDPCGRFRSKFKVLLSKRQFLYEFPATKCNQVDLNNCYTSELMVRIQVPFQTLVAMNVHNRRISIQINRFPEIGLKKSTERSGLTPKGKYYSEDNCLWIDAVQNSFLHKILLRKRQADNLKTYLCQFDPNFFILFDIGNNTGLTSMAFDTDSSLFEEELASTNLRKIYQKNKKNLVRRLPQWDSEAVFEPLELHKGDHLLSPNQVCSCRISCKSLRCSCVKAAKSCGTGGTVCLCINCDNPLDVLGSFGINLDFSLSDCCLFQNIYRIPKLRSFLQKSIKLKCCKTVARVLDCIPGTILCPNTECNESLEFSWCQVIICYPERNPRNHCSFCGLCCFTSKRHCPICNRCYVVTPKSPDCPNCRGSGIAMKPINQEKKYQVSDLHPELFVETSSTKSCSKPEIIVLDSSLNVKLGISPKKKDDIVNLKSEKSHLNMDNSGNEENKMFIKRELMEPLELVGSSLHKHDNAEVKTEIYEIPQENNSVNNDIKPDLEECKAETGDSRDVQPVADIKEEEDSLILENDVDYLSKNTEQS